MNEAVIFTSIPMCIAVAFTVIIHIGAAILSTIDRERLHTSPILLASIAEAIGVLLLLFVIGWGLVKGASADEVLLVLMISAASGIVSIGAAEKISGKNKN